jgi:eukaryotic-like serine/threonine-protein kinase
MQLGAGADSADFAPGESPGAGVQSIRRLGDYELFEEIARGGMGAVYRARQVSLNRTVAVKVLVGGQYTSEDFTKRFRREAEMAASLNHPNIVSIYEIGEQDDQPYFSMELVEGRSLAEVTREGPLPASQASQLLKTVAEAVHFAHEHRLLHRDLKPSNILVDSNGVPHITDFGLAKRVEATADLTVTGQVLGSPNYMPPEQADPKRGPPTAASDVYSLGAMFYQLLTSRPPFLAGTLTQTLRLVSEGEPVPPRLLNPSVPRDLETICLKCLEKDPHRRYTSAHELAVELGRFLRDEPIRARPISPLLKLMRWCHRKPALALALSAAATLFLAVAIGSPVAILRIHHARERAEAARKGEATLRVRAETLERQTEQRLYAALLEQARATVRSGDLGQRMRALDAIRRAAEITNTTDLQREALAALALPDLRFERELPTGRDCTTVTLDPNFERLALGRGTNDVEILSVTDQRPLVTLPASSPELATFAKWSRDGRFLGICRRKSTRGYLKNLEIWDVSSGQQRLYLPQTAWDAFSFHPSQPRLLRPTAENWIVLHDLESGTELKRFAVSGGVHHVEYSPDGRSFVAQHRVGGTTYQVGAEWHTSLFDADTGAQLSSFISGWIDGIAWHPEGRRVGMAARTGAVSLHDWKTGETRLLGHHKNEARTAVFSSDGGFLFTGGDEQEIICWDLRSLQRAFTIGLQSQSLQFRADGEQCAVPTKSALLLYGFERSLPCREMKGDLGGGASRGAISSDGRWLAVGGTDRLGLWDLTRDAPGVFATNLFNPPTPVFFPDASELLFFWVEGICRWRMAPGPDAGAPPEVTSLPVYNPGSFASVGFSNDRLALGTSHGLVLIPRTAIDAGPGELFPLGQARGRISPNGLWAAFRKSEPPRELVYGLNPWRDIKFLQFDADVLAEAFTPRSDELAVATHTSVTFLDTNRWEIQRRFPAALDRNAQILFMPDGQAFWLVHNASTAVLHGTQNFETLLPLPTGMIPLAVSPDARQLAVSVNARRVQVWDLHEVRNQFRELGLGWAEARSDVPVPKR